MTRCCGLLGALLLGACASLTAPASDASSQAGESAPTCAAGTGRCAGHVFQTCRGGVFRDETVCAAPRTCHAPLGGCVDCEPGRSVCRGDEVHRCADDGAVAEAVRTCPAGKCQDGLCTDPCSQAATARSYSGCSYWPTVTTNAMLQRDFSFAVVVSNINPVDVDVTIGRGQQHELVKATIAANQMGVFELPWVAGLAQTKNWQCLGDPSFCYDDGSVGSSSVLEPDGAFHLTSALPVVAYQFNPLNYRLEHDCQAGWDIVPNDNRCFSRSNEASLLLPEQALGDEYIVVSQPTCAVCLTKSICWGRPGFFAVVAVEPGVTQVSATFSANTSASQDGTIPAFYRGNKGTFSLSQGAVLQIVGPSDKNIPSCTPPLWWNGMTGSCEPPVPSDLTGTVITADKPVAVFVGHDITNLPLGLGPSNRLEEQLPPVRTWGSHYFGSRALSSGADPNVFRIISADGKNSLTFNPAVHDPVVLNRGEHIDVTTSADFEVKGTGRFAMAQFTLATYDAQNDTGPAMAMAVPVSQYRTSYHFLASTTFAQSYANVIAPQAAILSLDGAALAADQFSAIGTTGYRVARLKLAGGPHRITSSSSNGFAVVVYGTGMGTSYMYPGGMDLQPIE